MISLTRTAQGDAPGRRHGRSRRCAVYQDSTASCGRLAAARWSVSACRNAMTQPIVACPVSGSPPAGRRDKPPLALHTTIMDPITPRNRSRPAGADAYWRRRLFALAAGLAVLGLVVWAVGGAASPRPTAATTPAHHHAPHPNAPAAGGLPTSSSPSTTPSDTSRSQRHPRGGNHASQAAKPKAKHTPAVAAAGTHPRGGGDCRPADVVLTLTASSNSYGPAARPKFGIDVVSTASQTCTFNVGTRHLTLLIESGGVRVWNSA